MEKEDRSLAEPLATPWATAGGSESPVVKKSKPGISAGLCRGDSHAGREARLRHYCPIPPWVLKAWDRVCFSLCCTQVGRGDAESGQANALSTLSSAPLALRGSWELPSHPPNPDIPRSPAHSGSFPVKLCRSRPPSSLEHPKRLWVFVFYNFQMKRLRVREVRTFTQDHKASG